MKRIIASIFLIGFVLASTEFGELLKFPILIHHYFEHSQTDQQLTFGNYLQEHYKRTISHPDGKHQDHEKLPFQSGTCCSVHFISDVPSSLQIEISTAAYNEERKQCPRRHSDYFHSYLDNIWQPPKFC